MLTRRDCPGKATPLTLSAHNGEGTVVGPRGILDLDPSSPSSVAEPLRRTGVVPHAGRRVDLNHDLDRSGPARPGKGNPSQLGWSFVPQDADGETVMPPYCPEIARGAVVEILGRATGGISLGTLSGWDGDAGTLARVLAAKEWVSGGIAALNHRLQAGKPPASSNHPAGGTGEITPEFLEWIWTAISQGAGNEMVTCAETANYRVVLEAGGDAGCHAWSIEYPNQGYQGFGMLRVLDTIKSGGAAPAGLIDAQDGLPRAPLADLLGWAKAVELIAFLNTKVHAGFMFRVGGTSALTPALSRSGEGEFSAASVRCGSLGLSCGGHGERGRGGAAAGTLKDKRDVRGQVSVGGNKAMRNTAVAMAGMDGAAEGREPRPKVRRRGASSFRKILEVKC